jgi:hypothetical protein
MFFSPRGGYHKILMGVGPYNSYTGRGADDWGQRTILLVLKWFWDYRGGYPLFDSKGRCFLVDGRVCGWARRRDQRLEVRSCNS